MKSNGAKNILAVIRNLGRPVFTSHELIALSGKSPSTVTQSLTYLVGQGVLIKIYRGVWAEVGAKGISVFEVIPYLFPRQRVYVSFISALHVHGIIEQIPQTVTLASTAHTNTLKTRIGTYSVHRLAPAIFSGFDWYKGEGSFLIAEPEKALIDSLYLSSRKRKQFGHFPEMHFPRAFSFARAKKWIERIPEKKIRLYVSQKLEVLRKNWNL